MMGFLQLLFLVFSSSPHLGQICGPPEIVGAQTRQPSKERYNHGDKRQYTCNKSDYTFTVTCHLGEWEGIHDCSGK